ncbi:hypothetical protein EIP86_009945 [Pleurotus ostreatoroseus]|nr:hypothetical protein EIP86_009945 [Pleurotus ostreatoroseus]
MRSFELSRYSPLNTVLTDVDTGEKVRCVSSTPDFLRGTTRVSRYINEFPARGNESDDPSEEEPPQEGAPSSESEPRLEETGRVNWNFFTGTWMVYQGEKLSVSEFFPPTNFIRGARRFTGPDGNRYLHRKNGAGEKDTQVVKIDPNYIARTPAVMQVDDSVMPFFDLVLLTWVFIEQRRVGKAK